MLARTPSELPRVNVGCGATPTPGWVNIDNSPTVVLASMPWLWPFVPPSQRSFAAAARLAGVRSGVATRLKLATGSVGVLYSSHMMEHLDRAEAKAFLAEAYRVLAPGGIIRLALPDIRRKAEAYLASGDADEFVFSTRMFTDRPHGFVKRLRHVLVGARHHLWMYDGASLKRALTAAGFEQAETLAAGKTGILTPGPLDLREREAESVYAEAVKPR